MGATNTDTRPVVLITGASRGVGLGVACVLAAEGVPLMLTARGRERLDAAAQHLRADGTKIDTLACDAADEAAMTEAFRKAAQLGPLGAVLNNAGVLEPIAPIRDIDVAAFEAHLRTNVTGVLVGTKLAFLHRSTTIPLRVVNISSGAATHGYRSWAAYCSSKAAVNLLTEVASAEAAQQTSVVAVAPGIIETRMQRVIRGTSAQRFPDVAKFQQLKDEGALLHPIDAAVPLVWMLLEAPLTLSGSFLDARDASVQRQVTRLGEATMDRARAFFDRLESQDTAG